MQNMAGYLNFYLSFLFQEEFAGMIEDAGFTHVTYENLNFGIAAIHSGFKL
jgi:ubiquinone/menaquinone biosynthesis C-methylase UbiE